LMIPRVAELGGMLQVSKSDLKAMEHMKRQSVLEKIALIAVPAVSAIVGLLVGELAVPIRERSTSFYPFGPVMAAAPAVFLSSRRSWMATVVLSVVMFVLAFTVIAWVNTGMNASFGAGTKYSVYSRGT
jgi:hypothetical protein